MDLKLQEKIYKAKCKDECAILEIINIFNPIIKHLSYKLEKEDTSQELIVFLLQLIPKIPNRITEDKAIFRYISRSLKNKYISLMNESYHRNLIIYTDDIIEQTNCMEDDNNKIINKIILEKVLNELKKEERKIIVDLFIYEKSVKEISNQYNVSPQAIYQKYKRILNKIKKSYYQYL